MTGTLDGDKSVALYSVRTAGSMLDFVTISAVRVKNQK